MRFNSCGRRTCNRGRVKPGLCCKRELRERNVNDVVRLTGIYRLGDLSVEPEEPNDLPDAPLPVDPDDPDEPRDPLDDLLLTPKA